MADNAGAQPPLAVAAARAHRCGAVDEFDLADRFYLGRAIGPVHRTALDKDAVRNVVTAAGIGEQLVQKVAMLVTVPEMMVWIDDLERGFQNFLFSLRPPCGFTVARCRRRG